MRFVEYWTGWRRLGHTYLWLDKLSVLSLLLYSLPALGTVLCLATMVRQQQRGRWLLVSLFALYPAVYYVTHVSTRYRLPLEPLMFCLSAYAFIVGVQWASRRGKALRWVFGGYNVRPSTSP